MVDLCCNSDTSSGSMVVNDMVEVEVFPYSLSLFMHKLPVLGHEQSHVRIQSQSQNLPVSPS